MSLCINTSGNNISDDIFTPYEKSHPLTIDNFSSMENGAYWFDRLRAFENFNLYNHQNNNSVLEFDSGNVNFSSADYDIIYAGGGLSVLHGAVMSVVYGYNVCIFDRFEVGTTHRDWNISLTEIKKAVEVGLLTEDELSLIVAKHYSQGGFIKFYDKTSSVKTPALWMNDVLDIAIDANALLQIARKKIEFAGGKILNGTVFKKVISHNNGVHIIIERNGIIEKIGGRVFVDGMGINSPISKALNPSLQFTHCCPTVGTISSGFEQGNAENQVNKEVGEILVTLDDADESGRQLIWEGFPSNDDKFITYLFFYDKFNSNHDKSLLNLYEIFFRQLHTYKKPSKDFSIGRPLFGIIPSYLHKSLFQQKRISAHNILCVGDSAGLSSPLTYCGFGSFIRNIQRTTTLLHKALDSNNTDEKSLSRITAFESNVSIAANFAQFLVGNPHFPRHAVNETMNIILDILQNLPPTIGKELFQDTLSWSSYNTLMSTVPKMYPAAYKLLLRHHGINGLYWWFINFIGFSVQKWRGNVR